MNKMQLSDFAEILAFLCESLEGLTFVEIGETFSEKFGYQESIDAAAKMAFTGLAEGTEFFNMSGSPSLIPCKIRGTADGLNRLRECQRVMDFGGTDSEVAGWSIADSRNLVQALFADY